MKPWDIPEFLDSMAAVYGWKKVYKWIRFRWDLVQARNEKQAEKNRQKIREKYRARIQSTGKTVRRYRKMPLK